ncbi:MAG: tyrosine--tRNA ligase, partial [Bacteroidetes bacterium]|nr:tyrosine--tRNA ligase [Bacteroidota bacterium]
TNPLITKSDGGKFGKTEAGNIWLDPAKTSPYQFYQFWLNTSDHDATRWIKLFTFLAQEEIEKIISLHEQNPAARLLQRTLAAEITNFVHGQDELSKAIETTEKLFSNQQAPIESLSEADLEQIQGVVKVEIERNILRDGVDIITLLANTGIFPSKGEARKTTQGGGVSINRKKVETVDIKVNESFLIHNRYILVQKGKKNYFLITVKAV